MSFHLRIGFVDVRLKLWMISHYSLAMPAPSPYAGKSSTLDSDDTDVPSTFETPNLEFSAGPGPRSRNPKSAFCSSQPPEV